ncbi:hypothetical protein [Sphingobacterium sp.]|uniref:hypothetical protein n=1 Tax=Sphingobacterium sp. TaxID=341027 RepID=UPI0031DF4BFD
MRVRLADAFELEQYLSERQQEGRSLLSYNKDAGFFDKDTIRTFDDEFDAHMEAYDATTAQIYTRVVPLAPVLEAVRHLNNAMITEGGQYEGSSLTFDLEQLFSDYNYKQEVNNNAMEIENVNVEELSPLAKSLKYAGMGKVDNEELNKKMAEGQDVFSIGFKAEFKDAAAEAVIHCARSGKGMYYADSFDVTLQEAGKEDWTRNYRFPRTTNITIGDEIQKVKTGFTFKESVNQMKGQGVFKTFVFVDKQQPKNNRKYEAWEYINFSKTDVKGNFLTEKFYDLDVEKKVHSLPLVENMDYENVQRLCDSLKRGNIQSAKYLALDGKQEQIYLVANARFNTINAYDKEMKPISLHEKRKLELEALEQHKQEQKQSKEEKLKETRKEEKQKQKKGPKVRI